MTIFLQNYKVIFKKYFSKIKILQSIFLYMYNYKNINFLRQQITTRGKIIPRYFNSLTVKEHRLNINAIQRARNSRFIPFVWINILQNL